MSGSKKKRPRPDQLSADAEYMQRASLPDKGKG
jgi:hypothetical protein